MILRGFRYKLSPSADQEAMFRRFAGVCRLVYNLALEQRRDWWRHYERETGSKLNYVAQARQLTDLRAEFDWIRAVYVSCQQQALRDLDKAFTNFFAGRARYPSARKKGTNDTFRFPGREVEVRRLSGKWSVVRLPKIGWVKVRDTRPIRGEVKTVTITGDAGGWHVAFACEIEHDAPDNFRPAVGIDRGIAATLALSTGERLSVPPLWTGSRRRRDGRSASSPAANEGRAAMPGSGSVSPGSKPVPGASGAISTIAPHSTFRVGSASLCWKTCASRT